MIKIAVDAMGGDFAPEMIVAGACQAANDFDYEIILVGREAAIKRELHRHKVLGGKIFIHNANDVIGMDESPVAAIKSKKDASVTVCFDLLKKKEVDAVVTAGNTGAAVAAATLKVGLLSNVKRAGIAISLPTLKGLTLIIDVGANIDPKPEHLFQYAIMGDIFARSLHKKKRPTVSLLNIGEEETKGTEVLKETYKMLRESSLNFIGNVEGRDLFSGRSDIIICDGFVGNVLLKIVESIADTVREVMHRRISSNFLAKLGALCLRPVLADVKRDTDYTEAGGAPLLGIDGVVIISHGGSNDKAIRNAIKVAGSTVENDVNGLITRELSVLRPGSTAPAVEEE
ncbi:MAG: phosphate acyltransferase PlsX [Candidatus Omnitrophica bacterium]|nr:phosphate acyltransferase PlsX [Candidatus Omnitrophota bacterium]